MVAIDGLYGLFRPAWQANTRIYLRLFDLEFR